MNNYIFMQRCFSYYPTFVSNPELNFDRLPEIWSYINIIGIRSNTYKISTKGRIYSIPKQRLLNPVYNSDGYLEVKLLTIKGRQHFGVSRLVLMTFFPVFDMNILEANHINGKRDDNDIANIEWTTKGQNMHHTYLRGTNNQIGINNGNAKFTEEEVRKVCEYREQGMYASEIGEAMGLEYTHATKKRIENILFGITWKSISSQYNI